MKRYIEATTTLLCPFSMGVESLQPRECCTAKCMAWIWRDEDGEFGCCTLIPQTD